MDLKTNFSVQDMLELNLHEGKALQEGTSKRGSSNDSDAENVILTCNVHPFKSIMMVCISCEVGLCTECMKSLTKSQHREHRLEDIDTYLADFRRDLNSSKLLFHEIPTVIDQFQEAYDITISDMKRNWEKEIHEKAENAIEEVKKWQQLQKEHCKSAENANTLIAIDQVQLMQKSKEEIDHTITKIEDVYSSGRLPCISKVKSVMKALEEFESANCIIPHDISVGSINMVTEKHTERSVPISPSPSSQSIQPSRNLDRDSKGNRFTRYKSPPPPPDQGYPKRGGWRGGRGREGRQEGRGWGGGDGEGETGRMRRPRPRPRRGQQGGGDGEGETGRGATGRVATGSGRLRRGQRASRGKNELWGLDGC